MKVYWKVFFAIFIATSSVGALIIWASYRFMDHWTTKEYLSRYAAFSTVLGDALGNLDTSTEASMRNAAEIIAEKDAHDGLLSTNELKGMRSRINVTQIFVQNKKGDFIRSTNDDVRRIPNAFSFCDEYRKLATGELPLAATPLIRPYPEMEPYKFLYIPNRNHTRLLEVGVRVDLVAETLTKALGADPNLLSVSLYSPVGEILGRFSSSGIQYSDKNNQMPDALPQLIDHGDTFRYFIKVPSSHPKCCQCDVAGTSRNGEYYYVLESEISKQGLTALQATMNKAVVALCLIILLLALLISRFASQKLVKNIEDAAEKLKAIMAGAPDRRLHLTGKDEIAFLANQFDSLLDQFEDSQSKLIESEKLKTKVQMAREVAHNIKSPTIAIEMIMPLLKGVPQNVLKILSDSASDIKKLTERLLHQADEDDVQSLIVNRFIEPIHLKAFLENLIDKKNLEYNAGSSQYLLLRPSETFSRALIGAERVELTAVISNLINNASDSYLGDPKAIHIVCQAENGHCSVTIKDFGRGIPKEILEKLGREEISFGKLHGRGIGILHAFKRVRSWGGLINIESREGSGTTVTLTFPCALAADTPNVAESAQNNFSS